MTASVGSIASALTTASVTATAVSSTVGGIASTMTATSFHIEPLPPDPGSFEALIFAMDDVIIKLLG